MIKYDLMEEFMYGMQWLWMGMEDVEGMYKDYVKKVGEDEVLFKEIVREMRKHLELKERVENQIKETNEGYKVMELLNGSTAENLVDNDFTREDRGRLIKRASKKIEMEDIIGILRVREDIDKIKSRIIEEKVRKLYKNDKKEDEELEVKSIGKLSENKELKDSFIKGLKEMDRLGDRLDEYTYNYLEQSKRGGNYSYKKEKVLRDLASDMLMKHFRIRKYLKDKKEDYRKKEVWGESLEYMNNVVSKEEFKKEKRFESLVNDLLDNLEEDIIEEVIRIGLTMSDFMNKVDTRVQIDEMYEEFENEVTI